MSLAPLLLAGAILVPLLMAVMCLVAGFRRIAPFMLALAPLPAILAALLLPDGASLSFPVPFRLTLMLDRAGAILLGGAGLLWSMAGAYAGSYLGRKPGAGGFTVWWLLTLAGSLGVLIVADIASFYLMFTLVSIAGYGLVAHEQTQAARRAGLVYMVLALIGEAFLLVSFIMLASGQPDPNPLIRDAVAAMTASPMKDAIALFVILGFALKMGLVPLHVWLPLAHPAAPMPASAVLSGVVVKAGVIGMIRFLPFESGLPVWGAALVIAGLLTACYAALVGVTQVRPKTILAYSTVSQMGLVAAILGAGLATGDASARELSAYYGLHHTLVKGALFLGVGIVLVSGGAARWLVLAVMTVMGLSLGGLPLTSGALAKLVAKPIFGYGPASLAVSLAAAGSTMLMLHFSAMIARDSRQGDAAAARSGAPAGQTLPFLMVVLASLALSWWLYPVLSGEAPASALDAAALWKLGWPMGLGLALFGLTRLLPRLAGAIPEGDILVAAERQAGRFAAIPAGIARLDGILTRWSTGSLTLLVIALLIALLMGGRGLALP
jgi:formate hydrogenlyase subunit 3/multisubunit Na+/H+ antiporter MnhD subunit